MQILNSMTSYTIAVLHSLGTYLYAFARITFVCAYFFVRRIKFIKALNIFEAEIPVAIHLYNYNSYEKRLGLILLNLYSIRTKFNILLTRTIGM